MKPQRIEPGPGQESVWDYPRPPRVEPLSKRVRVIFNDVTIAETTDALRVLETSHPPGIYIPPQDVMMELLEGTPHRTACEFKGAARYWSVRAGDRCADNAAWSYPDPTENFQGIKDYISFYPGRVDACYIGDERVQAQASEFYGGWITSDIVGPFKGGAGTLFW